MLVYENEMYAPVQFLLFGIWHERIPYKWFFPRMLFDAFKY